MRAGNLRHKVDIYTPTEAVTALGEIETVNNHIGTFYANVLARPSTEAASDGTIISATGYTISLRYNSTDLTDISPSSYITFNGKVLQVRSVALMDFRQRMVQVVAEEAR